MKKQCHQCGNELDSLLPFKCKHCGELYCKDHYLPENHNCPNLPRSGWLIKNQYKPLKYHEKSNISESIPEIKVNRRKNYRDNNVHNSYKYEIKRLSMNMLRNKWFWIIVMPIILIIILYVYLLFTYGETCATSVLICIIVLIACILMMIFLPPRRRSILEEAEIEKGRLREIGSQQVRRRRW